MPGYRKLTAALLALALGIGIGIAFDNDMETRILGETGARYGNEAQGRVKSWFKVMRAAASLTEADKLRAVNSFFNALPNLEDDAHWGAQDYWATPLELIGSNGGDCEDFALAKYFTLRELGVPDERLRITYVKAYLRSSRQVQSHMVLSYYTTADAEPWLLDNLTDAIKPASQRGDLLPTYSFNVAGLWSAKERDAGRRLRDSDTLIAWRDLRLRMLRLTRSVQP